MEENLIRAVTNIEILPLIDVIKYFIARMSWLELNSITWHGLPTFFWWKLYEWTSITIERSKPVLIAQMSVAP
jgi:hypothetical protein